MRDTILKILKENKSGLMTYVVRNKIHYDYQNNQSTYVIRACLRNLEKDGLVKIIPSAYKKQLKWAIV